MARKSRKNNILNENSVAKSKFTINTALYIRLSVEDNKNRGNSIEHQQILLRNFVAVNPEFHVVKTYIDNGKTGTNFERPAFQEMIQDIEAGKIQCVIVKDLSRLGRNYIDTGYYIQSYFPSYKVRFIALSENFDTEKEDSNNILLPVLNMINESYAVDASKKIKEQAARDMKAGKFIGARPPYGYKKSPDDCHKLIIDEETAPVVKQIFQWVLDGVSYDKIAVMLNEAGVMTPSHYMKQQGLISSQNLIGQGYWQTFTIAKIVRSEIYTGDMVQGKSVTLQHKKIKTDKKDWIVVKNTHEAIISKEVFEKAQQCRMEIDKKSKSKNKTPYRENVLKGKIFCQCCGKNLNRGRRITKTKGEVYYFYCITNQRIKKGNCEGIHIKEQKVFQNILFLFDEKRNLFFEKEQHLQQQMQFMQKNIVLWKQQQTALEIQMNEKRSYLQTLYESFIDGVITQIEYKELRENYQNEIEDLLSEITCLEEIQQNTHQKIENILNLKEEFQSTQILEMTKEFADKFIERVEVFPDNTVTVKFYFDELLNEIEVNDIA
jgi:DNA invertase Pin-like site-specific DNA recombinase